MSDNSIQARKQAVRQQLKSARAALPESRRQSYSETIRDRLLVLDEVANAQTIFCFISYLNEVDTHGLLKYFLANGKDLAVPKIVPGKPMLAVPFHGWDELEKDAMGILTPASLEPHPGPFDLAITPGLGFTRAGHRIGYGRGYYDTWFANHPVKYKIALAFGVQLLDELPTEDTDLPVDLIVTENEVIRTAKHQR